MSLLGTATAWLVEPADDPSVRPVEPADEPSAQSDALAPPRATRGTPFLRVGPPATGEVPLSRVAPPATGEVPFSRVAPPATGEVPLSRVAVLGPAAAVPPLAAAVALNCRARARVPSALVALWRAPDAAGPPSRPGGPVLPGAAALAARLSRRDLPVVARGRLAWLALPAGCDDALPMLRRAEAAAGDLPVVLALARPRDEAIDAVLAERELLIVAAEPGCPLARVAEADACALGVPVRAWPPLPPGAARIAALAGLRGPHLDLGLEPADPSVRRLPVPSPRGPAPRDEACRLPVPVPPGAAPSEEAW